MCAPYTHALCLLLAVGLVIPVQMGSTLYAQPSDVAAVTVTAQDIGVEPGDNGRSIGGRRLFNRARYHAGDDPAWADPAFDDQDWEVVDPRLSPDDLPRQGWPGIGWFRIRLRVDASLHDHDLGFVILHSGAVEAYLDGQLVYRSGTVGATRAEEDPHVDLDPFVLPLDAGREHVLALRYSSFVTEGFRARWSPTGLAVYWGDRATMTRHRSFVRFNQGVFSAFYLAFALLFGLLYGLYRSERLFLYLAMLYGLLVPFLFIMHQVSFVQAPALWMPLIYAVVVFLEGALLAMLLVLYAFFYPARPRQFYGFILVGLATTIAVFMRLENAIYFIVWFFLVTVEILRIVAVALWRRKRWAWIIGIGFLPIIIIHLWGLLEALGLLTTPWSSSPFDPFMIGMVFFSSAFAVYVGIRFAESNKGLAAANEELAEANRTLEDRVARRTAALEESLAELKTTQAQLIQQEKMASLGQLTAGIAHEIKNPLNFVNNFSEIVVELSDELDDLLSPHLEASLQDEADDFRMILGDLKQNAGVIAQHGKRADGIVHAMMQHASGGSGQREPTDINALVSEHIDLAYHGKRAQVPDLTVEIKRDLGEEVGSVEIVPQEIGRVLLNLLGNAFDAVQEKADTETGYEPTVTVSTRRHGETVEIRVADNGLGIHKDFREKIFEPFFTTKPAGSGTGLGLSLSYDIVTQGHGGTLTVESTEGEGATFVVTLPPGT